MTKNNYLHKDGWGPFGRPGPWVDPAQKKNQKIVLVLEKKVENKQQPQKSKTHHRLVAKQQKKKKKNVIARRERRGNELGGEGKPRNEGCGPVHVRTCQNKKKTTGRKEIRVNLLNGP